MYKMGGIGMSHYFKFIKLEKGYQFVLIPNNNHGQPMGYSRVYDTYLLCNKALLEFRAFVREHMAENNKIVDKCNQNKYEYKIIDNEGKIMFYNRNYETKANAKKSMESVIKRINVPLK